MTIKSYFITQFIVLVLLLNSLIQNAADKRDVWSNMTINFT